MKSILTRATGYLRGVTSHSLQPYRGCSFGKSLCGVGCYVQHNPWLARGRPWGSFLDVRVNADRVYLDQIERERRWARSRCGEMSIFFSSSTDPFLPQDEQFGVSRKLLAAMLDEPPDCLIVQTHTHRVTSYLEELRRLKERARVRIHLSIESDRDRLPGLPPPASSVEARLEAAARLVVEGFFVAVCVSPLLPIRDPERFFSRIAGAACAVVLDHFIGGDGSPDGARTQATALPEAMAAVEPESLSPGYREQMAAVAERFLPGRVGIGAEGFAGRYR